MLYVFMYILVFRHELTPYNGAGMTSVKLFALHEITSVVDLSMYLLHDRRLMYSEKVVNYVCKRTIHICGTLWYMAFMYMIPYWSVTHGYNWLFTYTLFTLH